MTLWEPSASDDVLKVAVPLASETLPRDTAPSMKVTLPAGVPLPEVGATVAVKATAWPKTAGLAEETTLVVVAAGLTTCVKAGLDVLVVKLASPP